MPISSTKYGAKEKNLKKKTNLPHFFRMKNIYIGLLGLLALVACDDTTDTLGLYPESDEISTSSAIFDVHTKTLKMERVLSNNTKCYLGKVTDPETDAEIKADFLAQFNTLENYEFPDAELMVKNEAGEIEADSVEIRLYFEDFFGDATTPMKLHVYELNPDNIISEEEDYYSDIDLAAYTKPGQAPLVEKVFAATDYSVDESVSESSNYYKNVRIVLPKEYGTYILKKYYENPQNFANSYNFIRNVCPGFYFQLAGGNGTMLYLDVSTLNVYFRYKEKGEIVDGMSRFSATPEVIQSNRIENSNLDALAAQTQYTYLKTPAGLCTEMTLPIDEIYKSHPTDSISRAQITLTRYNSYEQDKYALGTPQTLLMVRKQDMEKFFSNKQVADNRTSYTTSFDENYNTYTFSNISRLISFSRNERLLEAAKEGITPEEWTAQHPDWNKVALIPVTVSTNTSGYQVSVTHDMKMNSVRLVGGETPIRMQVIYSKFN